MGDNDKNLFLMFFLVIIIGIFALFFGPKLTDAQTNSVYEKEIYSLINSARNYIKNNPQDIGNNVFHKLKADDKVTSGAIYINGRDEVALAIIFEKGESCYIKLFDSSLQKSDSPATCLKYVINYVNEYNKGTNN